MFPIIGGLMAEMWFGRFKTILYTSIIYEIGLILVVVASFSSVDNMNIFFIGL